MYIFSYNQICNYPNIDFQQEPLWQGKHLTSILKNMTNSKALGQTTGIQEVCGADQIIDSGLAVGQGKGTDGCRQGGDLFFP